MVMKWFKSFFKKKPETITVRFRLPNGKEFDLEGIRPLDYFHEYKCKIHLEYGGLTVPTNRCNTCWNYFKKKAK